MNDVISVGVIADQSMATERLTQITQEDSGICVAGVVASVASLGPATGVQVALLEARLADGTALHDNIAALTKHHVSVLVVGGGEDRDMIEHAARAGASGMVRRTADLTTTATAVRVAASGYDYVSADWAAAIDSHLALAQVPLSDTQEAIVSALASGETPSSIATRLEIAVTRVVEVLTSLRQQWVTSSPPLAQRGMHS